jgi:hypothetical protein
MRLRFDGSRCIDYRYEKRKDGELTRDIGAIWRVLTPSFRKPWKNEPFSEVIHSKIPLSSRGLKMSNCKSGCRRVDHVTALLIMWQRCWSCDSTVDVMWQCCRSCDSAVIEVIQKTVLSLDWQWLCCNCVSWFPFVLAYKTGLFLHSKRHSGNPFQLTQWTNFPQTVGRCRPKNWSKSITFDRLNRFLPFSI